MPYRPQFPRTTCAISSDASPCRTAEHGRTLTIPDPAHSQAKRFIILGKAHMRKLLVVVHTERSDSLRILSARIASRRERKHYEESIQ